MTRKVEIAFVKYHYVKVDVPADYPEDIDDWDADQFIAMQSQAKDKLPRGEWGWEINDDFEMELTND